MKIVKIIILLLIGIILVGGILAQFLLFDFQEPQARIIELSAKKFAFDPAFIKINKGDTVTIRFTSDDVHHGFFLDGYQIQTSAEPGTDGSITFVADKMGRFSYRCSVACGVFHPYMAGYFTVVPNLRFSIFAFLIMFVGLLSFSFVTFRKRRE